MTHDTLFTFQILIQPVLQALTFNTPSYRDNAYYSLVDRAQMMTNWCYYIGILPISKVLSSMERGRHVNPTVRRMLYFMYLADAEKVGAFSADENAQDSSVLPAASATPAQNPDLQEPDYDLEIAQAGVGVEVRVQDMYLAPIMSDDLRKAPSAVIMTGEQDIARDDGLVYASKLTKAGVNITLKRIPGIGQGHMAPLLPRSSYLAGWFTFSDSLWAWEYIYFQVKEKL
ncbi:neutral cholesterol ester hydrolase 1 [Elysia marginata]|uniref:Neutral cholesterol ester hydrolase 1 n=1 Tax=Elysia marginata TaxID=1093978 RepID=A0AAV4EGB5_9GAST|nr:neutral cholesterol ester hydrolase 1 [Elysia marginata]